MERPVILITHPLPATWLAPYQDEYQFIFGPEHPAGLSTYLQPWFGQAQGIISLLCDPIQAEELKRMPQIKVIGNLAAGTDNIDLDYCRQHGILVGNTPDVLTDATADATLALLLAVTRNLIPATRDASEGRWQMWEPAGWLGIQLTGKTMGIYGMGRIGRAVARRASSFGLEIIYHNRHPVAGESYRFVDFPALLRESDIISIHAPLNEESRGKFDREAFSQMRSGSILINTGRGPIVRTEALVEALEHGPLKAAGLDVTDPEPLPPDHILYRMANCLILPHIGSATEETRAKMTKMTLENIRAGLTRQPLPYPVK